ncbi:hypothetical protein K2173_025071 [Erythroxylum novogranatense]|uniref:Sulfotransferase n=1 Tax=Erythroxylum novogranatense TaxID=1862640 RepID=A0AAV8SW77_9ROSI|nr:hypothetical protein K2173_025071 [Erythroxylum novogranatense]
MGSEGHHLSMPELDQLPREFYWGTLDIHKFEGFWYHPQVLDPLMAMRRHFQARDDDIILASSMKTGTTWLKALCYCIMEDKKDSTSDDLLLKYHPHDCVPSLETKIYEDNMKPDLTGMPSPRLFHTHLPYQSLPNTVTKSSCKVVYITRDAKDTFVSMWHHNNKIFGAFFIPQFSLEKALDSFYRGVHFFGPFHDHVLQYWKESRENPQRILFLKYEELKREPKEQVKKLASFLGKPFNNEDEIENVLWRCSLDRLKNLEVNKNGEPVYPYVPNSSFFRLGIVGDWKNTLTTEMAERIDELTRAKFEGTGLDLE